MTARRRCALVVGLVLAATAGRAQELPAGDDAPRFGRDVLPLLVRHCGECHGDPVANAGQGAKGGLRIDAPAGLRRGGLGGPVVVPGEPGRSPLVQRLLLPDHDLDRMPPKGPGVPAADVEVLAAWIRTGADLGDGHDWDAGQDTVRAAPTASAEGWTGRRARLAALAAGLGPAPDAALTAAAEAGLVLTPVLPPDRALWRAGQRTDGEPTTDDDLARLAPLAQHLVMLDLGRSAVSDRGLERLGPLPRLLRLDLSATAVSAAGLAALAPLTHVEHLVLRETRVGDGAVASLSTLPVGAAVFHAGTRLTDPALALLAELRPGLRLHGALDFPPPAPRAPDEEPTRRR